MKLPESRLARALIASYGVLASVVGYWAIVDRQPIGDAAYEVLTPVVRPGGQFSVRYSIQWNSSCRVTGYRFIIDSAGDQYTLAPDTRWVAPGQPPEFTVTVPVPEAAHGGDAVYRAAFFYECNPFQKFFPLKGDLPDMAFQIRQECDEPKSVKVSGYCRRPPQR